MFWLFYYFTFLILFRSRQLLEQNYICIFPSPMNPFSVLFIPMTSTLLLRCSRHVFLNPFICISSTSSKRFCIPRHLKDRGCCSNVLKIIKLLVYHIFCMVISNIQIQRLRKRFPILLKPPKPIFDFFPKHCEIPGRYFSLSMIRIPKSQVKAYIILW